MSSDSRQESPRLGAAKRTFPALCSLVVLGLCLRPAAYAEEATSDEEPEVDEESFSPERCSEVNARAAELRDSGVEVITPAREGAHPEEGDASPDEVEPESPPDDAATEAEAGDEDPLDFVAEIEWEHTKSRQCHRYHGRFVCEGPRKVPIPHGEAAELAETLGIGTRRAAGRLMRGEYEQAWLDAIPYEAEETLHWPVDGGLLWRHFGNLVHRGRRRFHKGVDIGGRRGSIIRAVRSGLVTYSYNSIRGYGNVILVLHSDESMGLYAHNTANYVFAGQLVKRGQAIGEIGDTGIAYGAHLHFELRQRGRPINPYPLFEDVPPSPRDRNARRRNKRRSRR